MSCLTLEKDPLDRRQISIDFSEWLGSSTINAVSWVVPTGITEQSSSFSTTIATNYLSGGVDGQEYEVACSITTADAVPRIKTQRFKLQVENNC